MPENTEFVIPAILQEDLPEIILTEFYRTEKTNGLKTLGHLSRDEMDLGKKPLEFSAIASSSNTDDNE